MNLVFIAKSEAGITMKSLIVISCPLVAFLGDAENNDLNKYNQVMMLKIISGQNNSGIKVII